MKRSEINRAIQRAEAVMETHRFRLPPFAYWTPKQWASKNGEYNEIRDNMLGWDVTDHATGQFDKNGLVLFTIRNGNQQDKTYPKPYAEKIIVLDEKQQCPYHFHWYKMEDIINRGGGNLMICVYNAAADGTLADTPVTVCTDGRRMVVPAGHIVKLAPGESITLTPKMYHTFWAEQGHGPVLIGEVSQCNDDTVDNRFLEPLGRFPQIIEDEQPYRLLCTEYPAACT